MKKICFVTAARSEYGLLKWIMKDVKNSEEFDFSLIVTGSHLQEKFGHSIDEIINDGFIPDYVVESDIDNGTSLNVVNGMGKMMSGFSKAFDVVKPDYVVLLGDRYELLSIAGAALVMRIPIIHLSGGDVTLGAIDDKVRNAITMMATYHFPGNADSANNIARMLGSNENIWNIGEPGLDAFYREKLLSRDQLAQDLNIKSDLPWILMTYHPETMQSIEYNLQGVRNCVETLIECTNSIVVATYANADLGGKEINNYLEQVAEENGERIKVIPSLGQKRYLSFMREVSFVIGNSSSGIVEAPVLGIPVVNVGNRQLGRYMCPNIISTDISKDGIKRAVESVGKFDTENVQIDCQYWGNGNAAKRFTDVLKTIM